MLELGVFALPDLKAIPEEPLNLHPPPGVNWKAFGRFARPFEAQEKSLRDYYGKDLPGIGVRVEYREDAVKPRPASVTIDPHAYVRTFKAADEWGKSLKHPS